MNICLYFTSLGFSITKKEWTQTSHLYALIHNGSMHILNPDPIRPPHHTQHVSCWIACIAPFAYLVQMENYFPLYLVLSAFVGHDTKCFNNGVSASCALEEFRPLRPYSKEANIFTTFVAMTQIKQCYVLFTPGSSERKILEIITYCPKSSL